MFAGELIPGKLWEQKCEEKLVMDRFLRHYLLRKWFNPEP